jgi:hypothetical protein
MAAVYIAKRRPYKMNACVDVMSIRPIHLSPKLVTGGLKFVRIRQLRRSESGFNGRVPVVQSGVRY